MILILICCVMGASENWIVKKGTICYFTREDADSPSNLTVPNSHALVRVQRSQPSMRLRIRIAALERISQRGPRRACSEFVEAKCQEHDDMEFCEDHSETFAGHFNHQTHQLHSFHSKILIWLNAPCCPLNCYSCCHLFWKLSTVVIFSGNNGGSGWVRKSSPFEITQL